VCPPNLVGLGWILTENDPPFTRGVRHFSVVLQQCTNHNVEMANEISMKFCVDIKRRIVTFGTIQSYSPGGATFPDCFASFCSPVAIARSAVFLPNLATIRSYSWLRLIRSTQQVGLLLMSFWPGISTRIWQPHWPSRCSGGPTRSLQSGWTGCYAADWLNSFFVHYRYVDSRERVWNSYFDRLRVLLNLDWTVVAIVFSAGIWKSS